MLNHFNKLQLLLFLLLCLCACQQEKPAPSEKVEASEWTTEKLEKEGFRVFKENPSRAIFLFKILAQKYEAAKRLEKAGLTKLNISNIYDEYKNQADSALIFANASLEIWQELKDTLQQANLYKYAGLIKGKLNQTEAAKKDIQIAMELYQAVNFPMGIAVSEFNLANVFLQEGQLDQSKAFYEKATAFWRKENNMHRVFSNNFLGIELYEKLKEPQKLNTLIQENNNLRQTLELDDFLQHKYDALLKQYSPNE